MACSAILVVFTECRRLNYCGAKAVGHILLALMRVGSKKKTMQHPVEVSMPLRTGVFVSRDSLVELVAVAQLAAAYGG